MQTHIKYLWLIPLVQFSLRRTIIEIIYPKNMEQLEFKWNWHRQSKNQTYELIFNEMVKTLIKEEKLRAKIKQLVEVQRLNENVVPCIFHVTPKI